MGFVEYVLMLRVGNSGDIEWYSLVCSHFLHQLDFADYCSSQLCKWSTFLGATSWLFKVGNAGTRFTCAHILLTISAESDIEGWSEKGAQCQGQGV
jgi:hypothetical protein